MQRTLGSSTWVRLNRLRRQRRVQNWATIGLVVFGPVLAFTTFIALGPMAQRTALRLLVVADANGTRFCCGFTSIYGGVSREYPDP